MRNMKVVNDALDQLHAQMYAVSHWVVTLAALHPGSAQALLALPDNARTQLMFESQSDDQIDRCVAALRALNAAYAEMRVSIAKLDLQDFPPKTAGPSAG